MNESRTALKILREKMDAKENLEVSKTSASGGVSLKVVFLSNFVKPSYPLVRAAGSCLRPTAQPFLAILNPFFFPWFVTHETI